MIRSLLIYSDLKQVSELYILVPSDQHRCPVGQDGTQPLRESDPLYPASHPSCYTQTLYRLDGFLFPILSQFLAVCYARHRIDQKNSDTLRHDSVQTTEQARGTLLPLALYGLFICCMSYQTGQTDIHLLTLLRPTT